MGPEWVTAIIGASTVMLAMIARDGKATRATILDQRAEIRDLKSEIVDLKEEVRGLRRENQALLRQVAHLNGNGK